MDTVDNIRNNLINRILTIRNKDFLLALDKLISSSTDKNELFELTEEQELMLQMSDEDIINGRVVSQDDVKRNTQSWLKSRRNS